MEKILEIIRLGIMLIINIIFSFIFWKTNFIGKIVFLPFLICAISMFFQILAGLLNSNLNKKVFVNIYFISFLTYWFGFILFWSYQVIKMGSYKSLIFTIPFYIAGFIIIKKHFFKNKENKIIKFNIVSYIPAFLVILAFVIGIGVFSLGIVEKIKVSNNSKDYIETIGYFKNYYIDENSDDIVYKLVYEYEVKGENYQIITDYSTSVIPKTNSKIKIKYDENNPNNAIIIGSNGSNFMVFFGLFFILGALVFVVGLLTLNGYFAKFKIDVMGAVVGFVFALIGFGLLYINYSSYASWQELFKNFNFIMFISLLFIIVGLIKFFQSILVKNAKLVK